MATTEAYAAYNNIPKAELWERLQEREQKITELNGTIEQVEKARDMEVEARQAYIAEYEEDKKEIKFLKKYIKELILEGMA